MYCNFKNINYLIHNSIKSVLEKLSLGRKIHNNSWDFSEFQNLNFQMKLNPIYCFPSYEYIDHTFDQVLFSLQGFCIQTISILKVFVELFILRMYKDQVSMDLSHLNLKVISPFNSMCFTNSTVLIFN